MELDDPRIRKLDSLIKLGQEVAKTNIYYETVGLSEVNPVLFESWITQVEQFFLDNVDEKNAFVAKFNKEIINSKLIYRDESLVRTGVRLLQDLMKYLVDSPYPTTPKENSSKTSKEKSLDNRKVFIVHGHNETLKNEVESYLKTLDLEPIILHKQADLGKTIIEKVEHYSDVGFAIIILTADDFGGSFQNVSSIETGIDNDLLHRALNPAYKATITEKEKFLLSKEFGEMFEDVFSNCKLRARQNVIFEFGYFIGLLGRNRVAALCEVGIEIPSDINGLLYTPIDEKGEWKNKLVREIDAPGIRIAQRFL